MEFFKTKLVEYGLSNNLADNLSIIIAVFLIVLLCLLASFFVKKIVISIVSKQIKKRKMMWDVLLKRKVFNKLTKIIPGVGIYLFASFIIINQDILQRVAIIYILIIAIIVINSIIDSVEDIYKTYPISKVRPIKGLLQVTKIVIYIIIGIAIISILMGENPFLLLSGIGALAAVFSLVFKDSILGLVAGVQLSSNDMLRIGDWIEVPKAGADGIVTEISLNTIKIKNFDNTITTVPTYALISDSFKNWREMQESGARRIKRSIYIDMNSIKFCSEDMIERFKKIHFLTDYITAKEKEIKQYNVENKTEDSLINGRRLTNVGTFRAYIQNYLEKHPKVHNGMIQMVRQMPPQENGLPLEIYVFINDIEWVNFEGIQADIFDHIFAVINEFDLRVFQRTSGYDLKQFSKMN